MQKAQLTGGQTVSALVAGFVGNLFFTLGWTLVGFTLFGSALVALAGASLRRVIGAVVESQVLDQILGRTGTVIGTVAIIIGAVAVVLMVLGVVISGVILRSGKVRKPWAVTFASIGISALLGLPLFLLYATITLRRDSDAGFLLVSFLGTAIVGVLLWWWMTWARRGPAVTDPQIVAPPAVPAVKATAVKAPAVKATAVKAPAVKAPATKPSATKPPAASPKA